MNIAWCQLAILVTAEVNGGSSQQYYARLHPEPTVSMALDRSRGTRLLVAFWARAKLRAKTFWRSSP
jgi:hypothetical protein